MGNGKKDLLLALEQAVKSVKSMSDEAEFMALIIQFNSPSDNFITHVHCIDEE